MNLERINCPICGKDNTTVLATKGDLNLDVTNVICNTCALVYINPRPNADEMMAWQESSQKGSGHHRANTLDKARLKVEGNDNKIKEKVADWLIEKCIPNAIQNKDFKILDIGCGFGTLLNIIKKKTGLIGHGIELYKPDVEMAKNLFGLDLYHGSFKDYFLGPMGGRSASVKYDLIILHHTFEHLFNPHKDLEDIQHL